jgi:hypothetical protein
MRSPHFLTLALVSCVACSGSVTTTMTGSGTSSTGATTTAGTGVTGTGGHGTGGHGMGGHGTGGNGLGGHGGINGMGGNGMGGCPPFGLTDASGVGVTVGAGGAPPGDGGTELATVCVMAIAGLTGCQIPEAITSTLGPCYQLISIQSGPFLMGGNGNCWKVVVQKHCM